MADTTGIDRDLLKDKLSAEQFRVTQCGGTERPFTGPWLNETRAGRYACVCCGAELFRSDAKYDSGSGWPSFFAAAGPGVIREIADTSHFMRRVEIRCASCDAHLGHVFPDGPPQTGLRYCTNGAALDFTPQQS